MWQPDVTVAAICQRQGQFLLVEERAKSSQQIVFNQPAGHIEQGETILQAVIRETLEETCRHFTPQALLGLYKHQSVEEKTYIRYAFVGEISPVDSNFQLDPDIIRTHWMSLDAIRNNSSLRSPLVMACIDDYMAGTRYPLELLSEVE